MIWCCLAPCFGQKSNFREIERLICCLLRELNLRFPDDSGFLLNQRWTKTLRSRHANGFAFKMETNKDFLPSLGN